MKEKLYKLFPDIIQNLMISLYNLRAYRVRYGGQYQTYREKIKENKTLNLAGLKAYQSGRYTGFINKAIAHSTYYRELFQKIEGANAIENIHQLPITNKEDLRKNLDKIVSKTSEKLVKAKTGGTTGKSLEVYYTFQNMQERFAFLDDFRSQFGYELGKKTAWFSGKDLLTERDIKKKRFWKTDFFHKVRYYSTFHIHQKYLKYYLEDLIKFQPEFLIGFPSSIIDIAKYGMAHGYDFPAGMVKAVFPTAESVTADMRRIIEDFFKTKVYDQYASSEGAPFILECSKGNLHLELQSGVFEVLDENNQPAKSGRLVVTSFDTEGTPLIRYDIGDSIVLEDETKVCSCGNHNPMVREILGRIDDFVYSPENGKINLGNVSNTLKDTRGIICFQAIQNELNKIKVLVETDAKDFDAASQNKFIQNWRDRIGNAMELEIEFVNEIPVEKSGKFRIVKNNIKDLL